MAERAIFDGNETAFAQWKGARGIRGPIAALDTREGTQILKGCTNSLFARAESGVTLFAQKKNQNQNHR
jgi:hypothetical protein